MELIEVEKDIGTFGLHHRAAYRRDSFGICRAIEHCPQFLEIGEFMSLELEFSLNEGEHEFEAVNNSSKCFLMKVIFPSLNQVGAGQVQLRHQGIAFSQGLPIKYFLPLKKWI